MKQFNINDYPGKYAMHCKTEEEAKDFCRVMHEAGRKWDNGLPYTTTFWEICDGNMYFKFNKGVWLDHKSGVDGYTVLNWSDFMQHEFTKADLRDGMVGIDRVDRKYIILNGYFMEQNGVVCLCDPTYTMKNDLSFGENDPCDIMRICTSKGITLNEYFDDENLTTIWRRPDATVMTMDEIKKALGIEGELIIKEA